MTVEQVIEHVKKSDEFFHTEENEIIINALEKQIPKKPRKKEEYENGEEWVHCECGAVQLIDTKTHKKIHCWNCGQLLKVGEEDDN